MYQQYAHCVILYTSSFIFHLVNLKKKKKKNRHVSIIYIITLNYDYLRTPFRFAKTKKKCILSMCYSRATILIYRALESIILRTAEKKEQRKAPVKLSFSHVEHSPPVLYTHTYARTSLLKLTHSRGLYTLSIIIKKHTNAEPKLISNYYTRA